MKRIVYVVTVPVTANVLLRGQLSYLREAGFDITVISSPGPELDEVARREQVRVVGIPMTRSMSPVADAKAQAALIRTLRSLDPHLVNASTAKAGMLGMVAAAAVRTPVRVYLLRGLRLETEHGVRRTILSATERLASACAHRVVCVSQSLREAYVGAGLAPARKCVVLGAGSSNGVDTVRFARTPARIAEAAALRARLGIAPAAPVIGFVGRPVADKGIRELVAAFDRVRMDVPDARLMVVGAGFAGDATEEALARRTDVVLVPHVADPAPYYAVMDVLAFPSYREGLPNVPLEAAAAGVPTVGFAATGTIDAVRSGTTGVLAPIGDVPGLAQGLIQCLTDAGRRTSLGEAARKRVQTELSQSAVWAAWRSMYLELLV